MWGGWHLFPANCLLYLNWWSEIKTRQFSKKKKLNQTWLRKKAMQASEISLWQRWRNAQGSTWNEHIQLKWRDSNMQCRAVSFALFSPWSGEWYCACRPFISWSDPHTLDNSLGKCICLGVRRVTPDPLENITISHYLTFTITVAHLQWPIPEYTHTRKHICNLMFALLGLGYKDIISWQINCVCGTAPTPTSSPQTHTHRHTRIC